jgi:hypothetical protein
MVEVRYRGSFGDNLFQYCFGRLLAERWGYELRALPLPHFPNTAEPVSGHCCLTPFHSWSGIAAEERQLGMLLRGREMTAPLQGRLVLFGWFHRWEYYRGHEAKLRHWLETAPPTERARPGDLAICLRHRRPEAWEEPGIHAGHAPKWGVPAPSVEAIRRLVESTPHERLVLLTDAPLSPTVKELSRLNPVLRNIHCFSSWNWLRTCRRMAITVSHPAEWWAAQLSSAEEIYALDPWPADKQAHCGGPYGCGWVGGRPLGRPELRVTEPRWKYDW